MPTQFLYRDNHHQNILLEDFTSGIMVQANQHVIIHDGHAMLLDPGGHKVYSGALAELSAHIGTDDLKYIFFSHQDPDIVAAANGWMMITNATALLSNLWLRFIMHFGVDDMAADRIEGIPDRGRRIQLNGCELLIIPAHFMHSPGNFQVYDPVSKILYSGDLGASLGQTYTVVQNFTDHTQYMEGFHKRYIASNHTLRLWAQMVRQLDIETIAPQHGAMMVGKETVSQFIDWVETLPCGVDILDHVYQLP